MPFRKLLLGFGVFALCATASVAQKKAAAQAAQAEPAAKLQGIDDLVAQAMEEWKIPGLALGIVKDGKVIYAKGYGFRDVEHKLPVRTDTLFPIGSISKSHSVSAALEPALQEHIVFARAAEKISSDVLRTLTGEYVLNGMPVTVALAGDSLRLTVPGQPQYELAPTQGLTFDIKGMAGFSVEFKEDDTGKVTAAVFHQPNGVFTATRK